ncbi:sigma-54-dependent transcriptional regulator [Blastopirellula marina]|uniref:Sigma-54-dependent Fis family transcriptional regulator n=1 Tax=Blastopirellula marina TaxID=124 RepID=A0A2S8F6X6_9BACT|nr:sigma-54 dependent transcriptional regulator [Blastopirellula marina]PQO27890.1 sigma-54-dependent Fis family transcriptional regulator [Blastopirellula marina]PTL41626.1 sigma-54-dependent Fis family transcriptional regulator [Blastopirellula marina]
MKAHPERVDLLLVDDDEYLLEDLRAYFVRQKFRVQTATNATDALSLVKKHAFQVAVIDMQLPDLSGLELVRRFHEADTDCQVVILTGEGSIETAVEAMKLGTIDYLTKPVRLKELEAVILRAAQTYALRKQNQQLKGLIQQQTPGNNEIVGQSEAMQSVFRLIQRVGPTDKAVLIQGESGTGKELVAAAIHRSSPLADFPLVTVNCAALPEQLLESEMFGHEKGSFTGATAAKPGLFEVADGGTLFIDEIGELALPLQAKLLRVLEDGSFRRVGSIQERRADVRLIAATNRDLAAAAQAGQFREDLYYRLNVITISLPPLRQRSGDLALLVARFAGPDWTLEPGLIEALSRYDWPGNVRQLRNAVERAKILADGQRLELHNFPDEVALVDEPMTSHDEQPADLGQLTRQHIEQVYQAHEGNKTKAAQALGVSRRTLYRLLEKYDIAHL